MHICISQFYVYKYVCFVCTDDFKTAKHKLKLCQYLSDVASEAESVDVRRKRQRNKPSRYIDSNTSEDENTVPSKLTAPPKLNNILKNSSKIPCSFGTIILHYLC